MDTKGDKKMIVNVNNLPNSYEKYVVARVVDNELWFWGSWEDESEATHVAREIGGVVIVAE